MTKEITQILFPGYRANATIVATKTMDPIPQRSEIMIHLISNGGLYSSHRLYFVRVRLGFKEWFEEVFTPWYLTISPSFPQVKMIGFVNSIIWTDENLSCSVENLMEDLLISADSDDMKTFIPFDEWVKAYDQRGK